MGRIVFGRVIGLSEHDVSDVVLNGERLWETFVQDPLACQGERSSISARS